MVIRHFLISAGVNRSQSMPVRDASKNKTALKGHSYTWVMGGFHPQDLASK